MASQATAGTEWRVNSYTTGDQIKSAVSALADGGWIVTWQSAGQDGTDWGVYQQRYDADGSEVGEETLVNNVPNPVKPNANGFQSEASVSELADGGWIVAWQAANLQTKQWNIYERRYDADGNRVGGETLASTSLAGDQLRPTITSLTDGGWVVSWSSHVVNAQSWDIYQQRYDADGNAVGAEARVGGYTDAEADQDKTVVTALADGGWVVTWESMFLDGIHRGVDEQRYDADGNAVSGQVRVDTLGSADFGPANATALGDGGWLATWTGFTVINDATFYEIYQRRFDAAGNATGAESVVDTNITPSKEQPSTTVLADGGWVVTWQSQQDRFGGYGIYQQRFDADGHAIGSETRVNAFVTGDQTLSSVAGLADGGWVVTWQSDSQDGSGGGVYQRHFAADVVGTAHGETLTGTAWDEYLIGYGGNDTLDGKGGKDVMIGGFGNDTYIVDSAKDQIEEMPGQGTDTVLASVSFSLAKIAAVENLTLKGSASVDGTGNALANILTGNAGANTLHGGAGNDTLIGGVGKDQLYGDAGADIFRFGAGDTGKTGADADTIHGFQRADGDRIDLSHFDADSGNKGTQGFDFIGAADFSGHAGELRFDSTGGDTFVSGDVDGDGKADFVIHLDQGVELKVGDFLL